MADAFQDLASAFLVSNKAAAGVRFTIGSSTYLRTQLEHGADADVFASADQTQMDAARQANRLVGPDQVFARDRLILITPQANAKQIHTLKDLATQGVRWTTTDPSDPGEQAALALLDRASADPAYGSDFRAKAERNILSRIGTSDDVVDRVQHAEADASIVSASDVPTAVRAQLQVIDLPDAAILARWGFLILNPNTSVGVSPLPSPSATGGRQSPTPTPAP